MDKKSDNIKAANQTNNKKRSTSKCSKCNNKKNNKENNNSYKTLKNDGCKISDSCNQANTKLDLKLYEFSYADYILLSSTIAYAIGEELIDADLDILIAFFGMITSDLAILRTRRGIIQGLAKAKNTNNINNSEEDVIGAIESVESSEVIVENLSRNLENNNMGKINKRRIKKRRIKNDQK